MLQIRWRRWLTERYLGEWLKDTAYYRMQLAGGRDRQPGPAHRGGPAALRDRHAGARDRRHARRGHAGLLHRDPVGSLRLDDPARRRVSHDHPRLHGLGRAPLRDRRHLAHRPHRPAAGAHELRPAALRGGLPLRSRALPREHGGRGPVPRRGRRAAELQEPLRRGGRQLVGHHAPAEAVDVVHRRATARRRSSSPSWWRRLASSAARSRSAGSCRPPRHSARCRTRSRSS